MKESKNRQRVIRASEIGQWAYCSRAWWLGSIKGVPSTNTRAMAQGQKVHQQHGRAVWAARALRKVSMVLFAVAAVMLVAALLFVR